MAEGRDVALSAAVCGTGRGLRLRDLLRVGGAAVRGGPRADGRPRAVVRTYIIHSDREPLPRRAGPRHYTPLEGRLPRPVVLGRVDLCTPRSFYDGAFPHLHRFIGARQGVPIARRGLDYCDRGVGAVPVRRLPSGRSRRGLQGEARRGAVGRGPRGRRERGAGPGV